MYSPSTAMLRLLSKKGMPPYWLVELTRWRVPAVSGVALSSLTMASPQWVLPVISTPVAIASTPDAPSSAIVSGYNRLSKAMAASSSALRDDRASCSVARKSTPFQASRFWLAGDFTAPVTRDFG